MPCVWNQRSDFPASLQVVLGIVPAHGDTQSGGGTELHGLRLLPLHRLFPLLLRPEISPVLQLLPNFVQIPLTLRSLQGFQHALQIVQLASPLLQLLGQNGVRRLRLGIFLIVFRRILLRRQERVEGDRQLSQLRVLVIHRRQRLLALLHLKKVGGD